MKTNKLFMFAALSAISAQALASDALQQEARGIAKAFGGELKAEVQKSMKAGGPVPTIAICHDKAPKIAAAAAKKSGWDVSRTSLKIRNPENAADAWETKVMQAFEARQAKGEALNGMDYAETVETDGKKTFRYMMAIPTGKPCLHCHAAEIKAPVEASLKELYPNDQARGFKLGDMRGAFSLSKGL